MRANRSACRSASRLGTNSPEQERQECDADDDNRQRDGMGMIGDEIERNLPDCRGQRIDQFFAAKHRDERADQRHAELHRGQKAVGILRQFQRELGARDLPSSANCSSRPLREAMMAISAATKKPLAIISRKMMISVIEHFGNHPCDLAFRTSRLPVVTAMLSRWMISSCGRWPSAAAICSVFKPLIRSTSSAA